jgi:hypothetical protein
MRESAFRAEKMGADIAMEREILQHTVELGKLQVSVAAEEAKLGFMLYQRSVMQAFCGPPYHLIHCPCSRPCATSWRERPEPRMQNPNLISRVCGIDEIFESE